MNLPKPDPKENPSVYIIILNWNGYNDTLECISSVDKIDYKNHKVILIDNGSDTNEIDNILIHFPNIKIIKSKENLGFSGGNNLGIEHSIKEGAEYLLLLNNDTIVEPDFLNFLVENARKDDKIGMAVPKINYYSNRNIIWYAGGYVSKIRGSGFTTGEGNIDIKYSKNRFVSFATGCCLFNKR